ncbi:MAG: response regulator [Gammaproteobacteria bacterium]
MSITAVRRPAWHLPGGEKTVLVTDDDRTVRTVLARMLHADGYRVLEAEQGEKCLHLCSERQVDAFLIDLNLPGMDGTELCRRIRANDRYRVTPIICITVVDEELAATRAFEAGADDFITKPISPHTLKARLGGRLLKSAALRERDHGRTDLRPEFSQRTRRMLDAYAATGSFPAPEAQDVCILVSRVCAPADPHAGIAPGALFDMLATQLALQVECVYRHGGYVERCAGDGVTAVFDSPRRILEASACGIEILEVTRRKLEAGSAMLPVCAGVHCGEVLVGNLGTVTHPDFSVVGDVVNVAARLCDQAEPLSMLASEEVRRAVAGRASLVFTAPCVLDIRDPRGPVTVYNVLRRREQVAR